MDRTNQDKKSKIQGIKDRIGDSAFPPAAVLGAFASFIASAKGDARQPAPLMPVGLASPAKAEAPVPMDYQYSRTFVLGGDRADGLFRQSLSGIAVGASDRIFVLGDGEIRAFDSEGKPMRSFKAPDGALCFGVDTENRVFIGLKGRIEIYSESGNPIGKFSVDENGLPVSITAIKVRGQELLAADATSKLIRRYDPRGKLLGVVGAHGKIKGFMLPNKSLDFAVDGNGVIYAADPGRHRVSLWNPDGSLKSQFGKFGLTHPADFVGCCNPVNMAILPGGNIVTAEKVATRVKVYSQEGRLLAMIGAEYFDPRCIHLHLAVDSKGRILVADPVRKNVQIFSASPRSGDSRNV